jgi:ketosteroid isomerase-like protein
MKRILLLAVLVMVASSITLGQTPATPAATPASTPGKPAATPETPTAEKAAAGANVEQALMQIEQELTDAILKGDTSASERYLADDYTFIAPTGMASTKAEGLADMKSGALKIESSKMEDMKVRVYGDTAVVTYSSTDKGKYKDMDISGHYRWTDVFVKRDGKWQLVAGQGTPIMMPPGMK